MKRPTVMMAAVLCLFGSALGAQSLDVTISPASPDSEFLDSGATFDYALAAFRFEAAGGDVTLHELDLTPRGTRFTTGVSMLFACLDDGDANFDSALDTELWRGTPAQPKTTALLTTPLVIADGTFEDIWIVATFAPHAGSSQGESYSIDIANSADVDAGSASVTLGSPPPRSETALLIEFEVTHIWFKCSQLYINGSGLTPPYVLTIDGESVYFAAPATPAQQTPAGDYYHQMQDYRLKDDHTWLSFRTYRSFYRDDWENGESLPVQLMTGSTGTHDLGTVVYDLDGCDGPSDCGCSAFGPALCSAVPGAGDRALLGMLAFAIVAAMRYRDRRRHRCE